MTDPAPDTLAMPSPEEIKKAIQATEYKYFGHYEFDDKQWEAVEILVRCARAAHAIRAVTSPPCPRPINSAPEGQSSADCIASGNCGCSPGMDQRADAGQLRGEAMEKVSLHSPHQGQPAVHESPDNDRLQEQLVRGEMAENNVQGLLAIERSLRLQIANLQAENERLGKSSSTALDDREIMQAILDNWHVGPTTVIKAVFAVLERNSPGKDSREAVIEQIAKSIESITLHECNRRTGATMPKSADWLNGNDAGVERGLKYAAMTVRALSSG